MTRADTAAALDRRVLDGMTPRLSYTTREIAGATGLGMSNARHVLERLARNGTVTRIDPVWRGLPVNWRR